MTEPNRRPRIYDTAVCRLAAEELAPAVAEWMEDKADEKMIADLARALRYASDGYKLAKELERMWMIEPDAGLVETLDAHDLWGAERKAVKEWVAATGTTADLPDGTMVTFSRGVGEITGRDAECATYTVWNDECRSERKQGCGWVIAAEDITPFTDATVAAA